MNSPRCAPGEPGPQGAPGVADGPQQARGWVILHTGQCRVLAATAHQQVDLHVHQTGQQDEVTEVDDLGAGIVGPGVTHAGDVRR